jgi:hypothetical protein
MRDIRITNIPGKIYKSFLKEARKNKHSVEDEIRDTIFEYVIDRYPTQRDLLIGRLSRSRRLRILKRERGYRHLIH